MKKSVKNIYKAFRKKKIDIYGFDIEKTNESALIRIAFFLTIRELKSFNLITGSIKDIFDASVIRWCSNHMRNPGWAVLANLKSINDYRREIYNLTFNKNDNKSKNNSKRKSTDC